MQFSLSPKCLLSWDDVIVRLVGAMMLEQDDEWAVTCRYITLETVGSVYATIRTSTPISSRRCN